MALRRRAWPYYYYSVGDFDSPPDIAGLALWLAANLGITAVQGPVVATGTTPPTVTITGTPTNTANSTVEIDITTLGTLGVAIFQWKFNGVIQQTLQVTAASFPLAGTGLTATFAAGTYAANNVYTSVLTVSAWADQSGNGLNVTQATAANQPVYSVSGGPGGMPMLTFNAVAQFLSGASSPIATTGNWTVFLVLQAGSASAAGVAYSMGGLNGVSFAQGLVTGSRRELNFNGPGTDECTGTATSTNWEQWTATNTTTGPAQGFRVNGVAQAVAPGNLTAMTATAQSVGSRVASLLWLGNIGEIIIYSSTLVAAKIVQVESYLNKKWGT